jgi:hypothetical protein
MDWEQDVLFLVLTGDRIKLEDTDNANVLLRAEVLKPNKFSKKPA